MSEIESVGDRPWWMAGQRKAKRPRATDVGAACGHTRDLHGPDGKCRVYNRVVLGGGDEGGYVNPETGAQEPHAVIEPVKYQREACFCPGETEWYEAGLPSDGTWSWDPLEKNGGWRDPEARYVNGEYQWWIPGS